jgi:hypothetical protein
MDDEIFLSSDVSVWARISLVLFPFLPSEIYASLALFSSFAPAHDPRLLFAF